ncbi:hypothetical protein [uncultured Lacinutrix sp.]|uniref:hypothetical protein n=1 Tax=uncultured Lacinutrix sp. TaxID=574032 RepID=UPI00260F1F90|nr:hypothetical protein [uncultured Lacinutrix sp.]
MGFSYAVDMINRMKQERSRYLLNKKRSDSINKALTLNKKYSKELKFKTVTPEKMRVIKEKIHIKKKQEFKKTILVTIISIIIAVYITFKIFKFIFS